VKVEQEQDVTSILPLIAKWLAECNAKKFGMDPTFATIMDDLDTWLLERDGAILVAYDPDPVGFMMVFSTANFLCPGHVLLEKYWYVTEGHRGAAMPLYRAAKRWGKKHGCSHMLLSASNLASDRHDRIAQFCEKMGMTLFETSYIEEL